MDRLDGQLNHVNNPQSDDDQFQDLFTQEKHKNETSTQTDSPSSCQQSHLKMLNSYPQKCSCNENSSGMKSKQQSEDSNGTAIARLHYQIRKLRMEVGLLKLENQVLTKKNNLSRDEYYEGVINGMQMKINELAGIGDGSDSD